MSEVFTPLNSDRTERLRIAREKITLISGNLYVRGPGKKAVISVDGKMFQVVGISCGLPHCACDALIREVDHV